MAKTYPDLNINEYIKDKKLNINEMNPTDLLNVLKNKFPEHTNDNSATKLFFTIYTIINKKNIFDPTKSLVINQGWFTFVSNAMRSPQLSFFLTFCRLAYNVNGYIDTTEEISSIQIRKLAQIERTGTIVFYFLIVTSLIGLVTSFLVWKQPTEEQAWLLVGSGIFGGIGQILITSSYRFADASVIVSFEYSSLVWAVAIGFFLFGDIPHPIVFLGAFIVIGAGLYVIYRERRLARDFQPDASL